MDLELRFRGRSKSSRWSTIRSQRALDGLQKVITRKKPAFLLKFDNNGRQKLKPYELLSKIWGKQNQENGQKK